MRTTVLLKRVRQLKGFTLVEALLALLILSIALLAIASLVIATTKLMSHSFDRETATSFAAERLDNMEKDYDEIINGAENIGKFSLVWTVANVSDVKTVEITVSWGGAAGPNSIVMEREYAKLE